MSQQPMAASSSTVPGTQRTVTVYAKAPKFYIESSDQYGNVERRTARGARVCEYGGYVTVLDHDSSVVLGVKSNDVVCFGKV